MRSAVGRVCAAIVLAVLLQAAAFAQGKDVVEVANGDRIRGDVRRLQRGRLEFGTASAGTISIIWTQVVNLTSSQNLTIELVDGQRYHGSISTNPSGQIVVQTPSGPSPPLALTDIITITRAGAVLRERVTGSIEFGLTFTNAQRARTYSLEAEAEHRTRSWETAAALNSAVTARSDAPTLSRHDFDIDVRRWLRPRWFALGTAKLQEDKPLELDLRFLAAGGGGRALVQTNRGRLIVEGGLAYNAESYLNAPSTDHSPEALVAAAGEWFEPGSAMELSADARTFIGLSRQRVRLDLDGSVRRDFFWSLFWAANVTERFDSAPPADRPRTDFGLALSLGWDF